VDWLSDMELLPASPAATLDRYIGYYEPYATSHQALDRDEAVQAEVRNAATVLTRAVTLVRAGQFSAPARGVASPRPK
jgi:hypothetical protein